MTEGVQISGQVSLGDHDIIHADSQQLTELRRNVGLVPQRPCPLPMSIYDNVAYGCRIPGIRKRSKLDRIVKHYLQAVGLLRR
jgi:phosphate transport system ATP-binding protein